MAKNNSLFYRTISWFVLVLLSYSVSANNGIKLGDEISTENWSVEVDKKIVPVMLGGLVVPVLTSTNYYIENPDHGNFLYESATNKFTSAVEIDLIKRNQPPAGTTYPYRPTLYISLPGSKLEDWGTGTGNWIADWQNDLEKELGILYPKEEEGTVSSLTHQYMHIQVNWATLRNNRTQVGEAAKKIKRILNEKRYAWDVVMIGFSRGGVFAHELSRRLVNHEKVHTLTTVLLDPTAAVSMGDSYPDNRVSSNANRFKGFLYSNNEIFEKMDWFNSNNSWLSVDERSIPGYERYNKIRGSAGGNDSDHSNFPYHWLVYDPGKHSPTFSNYGFDFLYHYVFNKKTKGSFDPDGYTGVKTVRVSVEDLVVDIWLNVGDGQVSGGAELSVGPATAQGTFNVSADGFASQSSILIVQSYTTISTSRVEYAASMGDYELVEILYDGRLNLGSDIGYFSSEINLVEGTVDFELEINGVPELPIQIDSNDINVKLPDVNIGGSISNGVHKIEDKVTSFFRGGW